MKSFLLEVTVLDEKQLEIETYQNVFIADKTETAHIMACDQAIIGYPDSFNVETILIESI